MDDKAKKRTYRGRGNGSIKQVGNHYAVTTTVHGHRQYATVKTKADAERVIRDAREENRSWRLPKANLKITVLKFVLIWILSLTVKGTSLASYEEKLALYILPFFGDRIISTISVSDIRRFISALSDHGCSAKTIKNTVSVLSQMFNSAIAENYCQFNPCTLVSLPKVVRYKPCQIVDKDYYKFFDLIKGEKLEDYFFVAYTTGMRRGELVALTWDDINFEKSEINIRRQLQLDKINGTGKYYESSTKNQKTRTIVVPQATMDRLRRIQKAQQIMEEAHLLTNPHGYVFLSDDNSHLKFSTIQKHWDRLRKKNHEIHQMTRCHDLRGSYITHLYNLKIPIKTISIFSGHASVAFTLDRYCTITGRAKEEAAVEMNEDLRRNNIE